MQVTSKSIISTVLDVTGGSVSLDTAIHISYLIVSRLLFCGAPNTLNYIISCLVAALVGSLFVSYTPNCTLT